MTRISTGYPTTMTGLVNEIDNLRVKVQEQAAEIERLKLTPADKREDLRCPDFEQHCYWRIKPDEPKKVKLECWLHRNTGSLMYRYAGNDMTEYYIRIPELDREVTLPVEE